LLEEMKVHNSDYFYEGTEEIVDIGWLEQPLQQLLKAIIITLFRKNYLGVFRSSVWRLVELLIIS